MCAVIHRAFAEIYTQTFNLENAYLRLKIVFFGWLPYGGCHIGETPKITSLDQTASFDVQFIGVDPLIWAVRASEKKGEKSSPVGNLTNYEKTRPLTRP